MDPRELFIQTLAELMYVETTLADEVLPELREQVSEARFQRALDEHLDQTREHVARLEQVFEDMKVQPQREPSAAFDGLRRDHEETVRKLTDTTLRDLFNASAAAHTEHFEISAYHGAITLAVILGMPEAVKCLEQNLHEEEAALEKVEKGIPELLAGHLAPA